MKCNRNGNTLVFTFDAASGKPALIFDSEKCPNLTVDAAMHGYEQKIRDNAAIAREQKDGSVIDVTEAMRHDAISEMIAHLETNTTWNIKAGPRAAPQNPTILAIAAQMGCTYAEAEAEIARRFMAEMKGE